MNNQIISYWDWLLAPFYILIIGFIVARIKNRNIKRNPVYKYFLWGLYAKIFGAISLCLIYAYYYKAGGDTINYNADSTALVNLLFHSPKDFYRVWLSPITKEVLSCFNSDTGYVTYGYDKNAFMVVRLITPIKLISFNSYIVASILMAALSFTGVWKLYIIFCDYYPQLYKNFAISVLFIPSVEIGRASCRERV